MLTHISAHLTAAVEIATGAMPPRNDMVIDGCSRFADGAVVDPVSAAERSMTVPYMAFDDIFVNATGCSLTNACGAGTIENENGIP